MVAGKQGQGTALAFALGAHAVWGMMPVYLLLLQSVPSLEFVAWRLVFTLPFCLALIAVFADFSELKRVLRNRKIMFTLMASSAIIAVNWFLYIYAIQHGYVYAASLGYYILPLTMMLLGLVFLKEQLNRLQWSAVALAAFGVAALASGALTTMWLSLTMATTFGVYGLLRKTVDAGPLTGLTVEAMMLMPIALGVILWFWQSPYGVALGQNTSVTLALAASGPITAVPLMLFAAAARRLPYTVIGFLQFASPTIVFFLGLFVFGEELRPAQLACFVMIWAAAALFSWSLFRGGDPAPADEITSRGAGH